MCSGFVIQYLLTIFIIYLLFLLFCKASMMCCQNTHSPDCLFKIYQSSILYSVVHVFIVIDQYIMELKYSSALLQLINSYKSEKNAALQRDIIW